MSEASAEPAHISDRQRLQSLSETGLVDTPERAALSRYARIATRALNAPVSLVSLVDDQRQFFAGSHGLESPWKERRETPLSHSFCQHVVNDRSALIVEDARRDKRVCDNLAIDDLKVEAYAGIPISDSDGNVLGSFCVIDVHPRQWTEDELKLIQLLADEVAEEIELARRAWLAEKAETDLTEINEEIAAAHHRAAEQNAAVMHDLRTPLQVVSVAVKSLAEHPSISQSTSLAKTVEMLQRNVAQVIKLVKTSGQRYADDDLFQSVDVAKLVTGVCDDLAAGQSVAFDVSVEPAEVIADPMMIRRSVQNLLSNAVRFASLRIEVAVVCNDDMVRIVVEDDGEGLPSDDDYRRVWELGRRFHTTRSNTGIGLAVTRQLVQALGGSVRAGPSDLGGARFELLLPQARGV